MGHIALRDARAAISHALIEQGIDLGVIAAEWDALVSDTSTHPNVPHAYATIPTFHSGLLFRRDAADLVAAFLQRGVFPAGAA